ARFSSWCRRGVGILPRGLPSRREEMMTLEPRLSCYAALLAVSVAAASSAFAQSQNAAIAGIVRDADGHALAGVTVQASSPALIEKTRVVVTDGQGTYKIVELRPGVYTV